MTKSIIIENQFAFDKILKDSHEDIIRNNSEMSLTSKIISNNISIATLMSQSVIREIPFHICIFN